MIAVSGLAKWYGAQSLFEDVGFQLNPGCRYGLVGANGSGKTTLLRILAGQEEPSAGAVSKPRRLRLGTLRPVWFMQTVLPVQPLQHWFQADHLWDGNILALLEREQVVKTICSNS